MSKVCEITAKGPSVANNVSHAQNKTKTRQMPNLQVKSYDSEALSKTFKIKLTANAIRTLTKHGSLDDFLRNTKKHAQLSARLQKARKAIKALAVEAK